MLYKDSDTTTKVGVKDRQGRPDARHPGQRQRPGARQGRRKAKAPSAAAIREEIEHLAWCIRNNRPRTELRCRAGSRPGRRGHRPGHQRRHRQRQPTAKGGYLAFEEDWYDINDDATPDGSSVKEENEKLGGGLS